MIAVHRGHDDRSNRSDRDRQSGNRSWARADLAARDPSSNRPAAGARDHRDLHL